MRPLGDFAVGVKLHIPSFPRHDSGSRYSTVLYSDDEIVLLKPEFGTAFLETPDREGFELFEAASYQTIEDLGTDLMWAIENACWLDSRGKNNLYGPTTHMKNAVENWKRRHNV